VGRVCFFFLRLMSPLHLLTRPARSRPVEILRRTQNRLAALNNTTRWPEQPGFKHRAADLRHARLRRAQRRADRPAETSAPLAADSTLEEYVKELPDSVYAMEHSMEHSDEVWTFPPSALAKIGGTQVWLLTWTETRARPPDGELISSSLSSSSTRKSAIAYCWRRRPCHWQRPEPDSNFRHSATPPLRL
jgi:hypothetical protein